MFKTEQPKKSKYLIHCNKKAIPDSGILFNMGLWQMGLMKVIELLHYY
jgi:hypothetical protein